MVFSLQHRSGCGVAEQGWRTQFPGLMSSGWIQDESGRELETECSRPDPCVLSHNPKESGKDKAPWTFFSSNTSPANWIPDPFSSLGQESGVSWLQGEPAARKVPCP